MTSVPVHSTRSRAWFLLVVLAVAPPLAWGPASADIVLAPWGGNIVIVGSQSNAGSAEDIESQSAPGSMWGTTLVSSADDNAVNAHAAAYMTIGTSFSNTGLGCNSVGQGSTNNSGGTNKGGVLAYVQFLVQQTQQYHSEVQLVPGTFGSDNSVVFISNLMSDNLAVVSLLGGPGTYVVDGRLSPGSYIFYYVNSYNTQSDDGTCNTVLAGVNFTNVPNPLIHDHPQSQTVNQGSTTSFSVGAGGLESQAVNAPGDVTAALAYQWRRNYQNLANGGRISGATTNHLVISNTAFADSGLYDCVVTQDAIVEPSSAARLTVVSGTTAVELPGSMSALSLALPAPSPFLSRTLVRFTLPRESEVVLDVLDVGGRRIKMLANGDRMSPGTHEIEWDGATDHGNRAPGGVYFVRMRAGSEQLSRRVVRIGS